MFRCNHSSGLLMILAYVIAEKSIGNADNDTFCKSYRQYFYRYFFRQQSVLIGYIRFSAFSGNQPMCKSHSQRPPTANESKSRRLADSCW